MSAPSVLRTGARKSARERERSGRVSGIYAVVRTFLTSRKAGDPAETAQRAEYVSSAGEKLVRIALVTYVEYEFVVGTIENVMHRDDGLDHAEIGGKMPSSGKNGRNDDLAHVRREIVHLREIEFFEIGGSVDLLQYLHSLFPLRDPLSHVSAFPAKKTISALLRIATVLNAAFPPTVIAAIIPDTAIDGKTGEMPIAAAIAEAIPLPQAPDRTPHTSPITSAQTLLTFSAPSIRAKTVSAHSQSAFSERQ